MWAARHLPWLGLGFFVVIPVIGGLIYGPLIYRYAREARGHGVPEVMIAVAENGGRIRPQVSVVKALASALCIGTGGSVGREGPIVQIGSALASSLGQWVRMPENRMRILVACGAGGGIAATFNAPITGVFFGVEIILREFSVDALFTVMLSAMIADAVAIPFLGSQPFLYGFPPGIALRHPGDYLLVAVLAVVAALIGAGVQERRVQDGRPLGHRRGRTARNGPGPPSAASPSAWCCWRCRRCTASATRSCTRPWRATTLLWFLLVLAAGKILACSLTLGIGGSGGVFAPSLFVGVTSGMAFGEIADHLLGPGAGQPALYAVVAMGAVFTSAARAPLTSVASVVEMTGDYALTLPVMLAVAIATATSRALSYGTIYTTKLLRRGQDIDRAAPWRAFGDLKAADACAPSRPARRRPTASTRRHGNRARRPWPGCPGRSPTRRPAGRLRQRVAGPDAAPARGLRPRRAAGAVRRRQPGPGLDHQRQRAARRRRRDRRAPRRSPPRRGRPRPGILRAEPPTPLPATRSSRSPSARTRPPQAGTRRHHLAARRPSRSPSCATAA